MIQVVNTIGQVNSRGFSYNARIPDYSRSSVEIEKAVSEAKDLMSDGQWYLNRRIYAIAEKHGVRRGDLMYKLTVAVSDCDHYFCIPNEFTPLEPQKPF